jgi:predicted NACHT family NTPase
LIGAAANFAGELSGISFSVDWLTKQLETGNCLLLLDGLDEVANEHRANLIESIQAFERKYPKNQIVVSCRKSVFNIGLQGFSIFEVRPFSFHDIQDFALNWFIDDNQTAQKFISDFSHSKSAQDICRTPLLCTLFLIMYGYARSLPSHRAELYERCIDALLFHWDTYRAIERKSLSSDLSHARKKSVLSKIGRKTFDRHTYVFRKPVLLGLVQKELDALGIEDELSAEDFINEIEDNHGLLVQRGPDRYAFSHLSFQEYFAAYHYVHSQQMAELFQMLKRDQRYREVFLLAVELSFEPSKLILGVISMATNERNTAGFYHDLVREILTIRIPINAKLRQVMQSLANDLPTLENFNDDDPEIEKDFEILSVDEMFDEQ